MWIYRCNQNINLCRIILTSNYTKHFHFLSLSNASFNISFWGHTKCGKFLTFKVKFFLCMILCMNYFHSLFISIKLVSSYASQYHWQILSFKIMWCKRKKCSVFFLWNKKKNIPPPFRILILKTLAQNQVINFCGFIKKKKPFTTSTTFIKLCLKRETKMRKISCNVSLI